MPLRSSAPVPPRPPTGWRRFAARLRIHLFRWGLAWIFGKLLPLLHHTGRVTGTERRAVLEVVEYAAADIAWTVASGFGPQAACTATCARSRKS
ncbi:hypothetical protein [Streptomyces sp. MAI_2237]